MAPSFVITGTGRCGSAYIARVLTDCGVPCGHEKWFNPYGTTDNSFVGESSCFALPVGLYGFGGKVFHQVRHPLGVISSLLREPPAGPALHLYRRLVGDDNEETLQFAAKAWLAYTKEADRCAVSAWRVDQISAQLVRGLAAMMDCHVKTSTVDRVLKTVPRDYNHHHGVGRPVTWEELSRFDLRLANKIFIRAQGYGFMG